MLNVLSYFFIILFAVLTAFEVPYAVNFVAGGWKAYIPILIGVGCNIVLSIIPFFSKNKEHLQTLSHELTHWFVGILFFKKIHSLNVEQDTGSVVHSGGRFGRIFISLSPYCFPILTFFLLLLRFLVAKEYLWGYDIAVGLTLGFHIGCFRSQIGNHQTDITKIGLFKSYVFIVASWLFFFMIILFSVRTDLWSAVKMIFTGYWATLISFWDWIAGLFANVAK